MRQSIIKRTFQMLHQRARKGRIIVEVYLFSQDRKISGFFDISSSTGNQPERVIIESASNIRISFLCQRLVLVVGTSILKLSCSNIQNSLSCAIWDQMDKT